MSLLLCTLASMALADEVKRDRPGDTMPTRHWDFIHLDLALRLHPEEGRLEGVATHQVRPLGERHQTLRLLPLHQPIQYRQ